MNNSDLISVSLVFVTLALVWFTYILARETKLLRISQTEPHVTSYIDSKNDFPVFMLFIRNDGSGPAFNVKFVFKYNYEVENDSIRGLKDKIDSLYVVKSGIQYLPVKSEFKYYLISPFGHLDKLKLFSIDMTATYNNSDGMKFSSKSSIDFSCYEKHALNTNYHKKIAESVDEIAKSISKMSGFNGELKVVTKTQKQKELEDRQERDDAEEFFSKQGIE